MAKRPLKVFRTAIGFHDAYVATTSRKAALKAWGAATDLFASGAAEPVTDPKLAKAALDRPGTVIRVARGTTAQHLAAAGRKPAGKVRAPSKEVVHKAPAPRKKAPRPSRAKLDRAEAAFTRKNDAYAAALAQIEAEMDALRQKREALRQKREALRQDRDAQLRKLEQRRRAEEDAYRAAIEDWDG